MAFLKEEYGTFVGIADSAHFLLLKEWKAK